MAADLLDPTAPVRDIIGLLQSPVEDLTTLLALLCGPLDCLALLPSKFRKFNTRALGNGAVSVSRHIPPLQRALLEYIIPTWESTLLETDAIALVEQYFCPGTFSSASSAAGEVTLLAYSTILSLPITEFTSRLLLRLSKEYSVDRLYAAVFSRDVYTGARKAITWEDCVRNVIAVPAKVANALRGDIPPALEHGIYFNNVAARCEVLIYNASLSTSRDVPSIAYLLTKLANIGLFPPSPPTSRSQPSFFQTNLPTIRSRISQEDSVLYTQLFVDVLLSLQSTFTLRVILTSLFTSLSKVVDTGCLPHERVSVKREAYLLYKLAGSLKPTNSELWECATSIIMGREWSEGFGRIVVCWIAAAFEDATNVQALECLLSIVMETWASAEYIKHSVLARHKYLTALLLLIVSYFPASSEPLQSIAVSPTFITGVGTYLSHLDNSVRHCGMLVAEVVAKRTGRNLDFGDWNGNDSGKIWARDIRLLIEQRDTDAELDIASDLSFISSDDELGRKPPDIQAPPGPPPPARAVIQTESGYDSDDSITGYASPSSSRTPSPSPSELEEIEDDPTINVGVKKVTRPVYLVQLGALVRGSSGLNVNNDEQEADKIQVALDCAEELIRRKKDYGTELEENAVNLVYGFVGLQNNFELDEFEAKRQGALNALVACCPQKSAPALIEEFFKNQYSTNQRYAILNALALGARDLALLPIPPSRVSKERTLFPSKTLAARLHTKYLTAAADANGAVRQILEGITNAATENGRDAAAEQAPALVRERRLRLKQPAKVTAVGNIPTAKPSLAIPITFTDVAAEFFIVPLINRFWLFLRDEQAREERSVYQQNQYRSAGTGLILNPIVLVHFLSTLAVLVNAAQNAPEWMAVIAPDALELAVTLGTRPISQLEVEDSEDHAAEGIQGREASVLTTSLELALVILDGCLELDSGRALGLDHTALLLSIGEWAGAIFSLLDRGSRITGGGGVQEVKLRRAAAGVLLKVDELTSKWRRSMIDVMSLNPP